MPILATEARISESARALIEGLSVQPRPKRQRRGGRPGWQRRLRRAEREYHRARTPQERTYWLGELIRARAAVPARRQAGVPS